jgi:chromosome segregation ATPase
MVLFPPTDADDQTAAEPPKRKRKPQPPTEEALASLGETLKLLPESERARLREQLQNAPSEADRRKIVADLQRAHATISAPVAESIAVRKARERQEADDARAARVAAIDIAEAISATAAARAEHEDAKDSLRKAAESRTSLDERIAELESRIAEQEEAADRAAGEDFLDERPNHGDTSKSLERNKSALRGARKAIEIADERVNAARQRVVQTKQRLDDEGGDLTAALHARALGLSRSVLAKLASPLAQLIAADIARKKLLGDRSTFDGARVAPISGATVAKALIAGLPSKLRIPQLEEAAIEKAANDLAADLFLKIGKGAQ